MVVNCNYLVNVNFSVLFVSIIYSTLAFIINVVDNSKHYGLYVFDCRKTLSLIEYVLFFNTVTSNRVDDAATLFSPTRLVTLANKVALGSFVHR